MSQNSTKPDKLGQVADAMTGNWVDSFAPIKLRPYYDCRGRTVQLEHGYC